MKTDVYINTSSNGLISIDVIFTDENEDETSNSVEIDPSFRIVITSQDNSGVGIIATKE